MRRTHFLYALGILSLLLTACGDSETTDEGGEQEPSKVVETNKIVRSINSNMGCALDADCVSGAFCFQGKCVVQCSKDASLGCENGYLCDDSRGRCVTSNYVAELARIDEEIKAAGDTMSDEEKAARLAGIELKAAKESNVRRSIIGQENEEGQIVQGIKFARRMPQAVILDKSANSQTVSFDTAEPVGDIQYVVYVKGLELPVLKTAKGVKNTDGTYTYQFEIDSAKIVQKRRSKLRSGDGITPESENVEIVSDAGNFQIQMAEAPVSKGVYEGYASPDKVLSGIELPIRMGIETVPATVKAFSDIESIKIMLPVSSIDIFSPENLAEDGKETWAALEMSKKSAADCGSSKPCFAADFSTNNYAPAGSVLFGAESRVNRNLRIELYEYDAASLTFAGRIVDGLKGLYRESAIEGGNIIRTWNDSEMEGEFTVMLTRAISEDMSIHDHQRENETIRSESDEPVNVCTTSHIKKLVQTLASSSPYKDIVCDTLTETDKIAECQAYSKCEDISSVDALNALSSDEQWNCVSLMTDSILNDDARLSSVLQKVLESDVDSSEPTSDPIVTVCQNIEIHNFKDFKEACANENCSLCDERPELLCMADLLARKYLNNELETADQVALMDKWISVMRESYLAQEYLSWNQDTEVRKSWLEGASYENASFAASIMDNFNDRLLKTYREQVLDVQHDVMHKQFMQTTLEMLSQTLVDTASSIGSGENSYQLSSARNTILSELAQTWESVGRSLGLSANRYDVLLQDDARRIQTAKELRPYLFDLYFAGILESAINLKADQGSLNASYGANLSNIIGKIESLDQTFEDLVFMRDGEIFVDTSLDTGNGLTALGKTQKAAKDSVDKAVARREAVFTKIDNSAKESLSVQDSYLSSLESMRAEIVNLCGYPSDCTTDEQKKTCMLFTDAYFCGFSISGTSSKPVAIDVTSDPSKSSSTISQITSYNECVKTKKTETTKSDAEIQKDCAGRNLALEEDTVSYTDGMSVSEAGLAILAYREAEQEYQTALSEYDVLSQKVANNFATLDAYAKNIEQWHTDRSDALKKISAKIEAIEQYESDLITFNNKASALEVSELAAEYTAQANALKDWNSMAYDNMAVQETMQSIISAATISDIWLNKFKDDADDEAQQSALEGILVNTAVLGAGSTAPYAAKTLLVSQASKTAAASLGYADAGLQTAIASAEAAAALSQNAFDYKIEKLDRNTELSLAELQKNLAADLDELTITVKGLDDKNINVNSDDLNKLISDLEHDNDELLANMKNEDAYKRDLQDLDIMRNEFRNVVLDLIPLAHTVKVKEIAKYRALINYLTIVQRAQLVASQYDSKLARYQMISNQLFSAANFFQTASDLESVESFIEYARNDLSDYLTAIEYLTVRPFVELRRSIYTARGTNDFEMIYEQLNDLTDNCGSGKDSTNKVTISLRDRLGIADASFNEISAEDRFHLTLAKGNLPVSAQTRYTVTGTIGDELKAGEFYSASFNLGTKFANIATSCNAKIDNIEVRFVSKEGKKIRESGSAIPSVSLFYGGQTQLLSCHKDIDKITASIGPRTTYGKFSTFTASPFADGMNAGVYEVPEGTKYEFSDNVEFSGVTNYKGLNGYPLMATYTLVFDPKKGENDKISWDNIADIEIMINYTTGTLGMDSNACRYDIE